jgi:hypothetical protein
MFRTKYDEQTGLYHVSRLGVHSQVPSEAPPNLEICALEVDWRIRPKWRVTASGLSKTKCDGITQPFKLLSGSDRTYRFYSNKTYGRMTTWLLRTSYDVMTSKYTVEESDPIMTMPLIALPTTPATSNSRGSLFRDWQPFAEDFTREEFLELTLNWKIVNGSDKGLFKYLRCKTHTNCEHMFRSKYNSETQMYNVMEAGVHVSEEGEICGQSGWRLVASELMADQFQEIFSTHDVVHGNEYCMVCCSHFRFCCQVTNDYACVVYSISHVNSTLTVTTCI